MEDIVQRFRKADKQFIKFVDGKDLDYKSN
jgi:hypothetical protein